MLKLSKLLVAPMVMPYVTTDLNMRQILTAIKRGSSKKPKLKENLKQIQKQTSTPTSRKVINIKELKSFSKYQLSDLINAVSAPRISSKVLLSNTK